MKNISVSSMDRVRKAKLYKKNPILQLIFLGVFLLKKSTIYKFKVPPFFLKSLDINFF